MASIEPFVEARHALDRKRFLALYSTPVLVLRTTADDAELGYHTARMTTGAVAAAVARPAVAVEVVPIAKRAQDPFPNFIWVGREPQCDVVLPFDGLSKLHAQFVRRPDGQFDLLDTGSTNGTWIDGQRLAVNKPGRVADQSFLRFGSVEARFRTAEGFWEELGAYPVRSGR